MFYPRAHGTDDHRLSERVFIGSVLAIRSVSVEHVELDLSERVFRVFIS